MTVRFGLIAAVAVVMLCGDAETAQAQIVTITQTGYIAADPNFNGNPSVNPAGTFTVAAKAAKWQIQWDYGALVDNTYTVNGKIGAGGAQTKTVTGMNGDNNGKWGNVGAEGLLLKPLPANTAIRAQIGMIVAGQFKPMGNPAYFPLN
jgi:hypothetical protein